MKKKVLSLMLAAMMAMTVVAGCGSSKSSESTSDASTESSEAADSTEAADGTETAVTSRTNLDATCQLTVDVVNQVVAKLRAQNTPTIDGKYVAIIHPYVAYDLMRDPEWIDAHKYAKPENLYEILDGNNIGTKFVAKQ